MAWRRKRWTCLGTSCATTSRVRRQHSTAQHDAHHRAALVRLPQLCATPVHWPAMLASCQALEGCGSGGPQAVRLLLTPVVLRLHAGAGAGAGPALARENTTGELALLVAEYGLLLQQLDVLADSIASQMAPLEGSSGGGHGIPQQPAAASAAAAAASAAAGAGKSPGLSIVNDDLLTELAAEIPDLRYRVGVSDAEVFGANPLSPTRLKLQVRENGLKVLEGVNFLTRGVRLLGSDVGNAGEGRGPVGGQCVSPWVRCYRQLSGRGDEEDGTGHGLHVSWGSGTHSQACGAAGALPLYLSAPCVCVRVSLQHTHPPLPPQAACS